MRDDYTGPPERCRSWLPIVASHDRNQHLRTRIKPHTGWSVSPCRCACSRVPAYAAARRLRAPLCTSFTWGGEHHWDASAGWVQNATRATSRIPSHSDADLRRNTKPGLGKRWIAIDLRDCLRIVVGLPLPQL